MTPIVEIYDYLSNGGFLGSWDGPAGTEPPVKVQMRELREDSIESDERCLFIKKMGSSGDRFSNDGPYTFAVLGKVGEEAVYPEAFAQVIFDAMVEFEQGEYILDIYALTGVNGCYRMESGRPAYDMEFNIKEDTGAV